MDDLFAQLVTYLGGINMWYAVGAVAAYVFFGNKLSGLFSLLGSIKLPALGGSTPTPSLPSTPPTAPADLNAWLEAHPLLDRLWVRLKDSFANQVTTGKVSEDDAFAVLTKALKDAGSK